MAAEARGEVVAHRTGQRVTSKPNETSAPESADPEATIVVPPDGPGAVIAERPPFSVATIAERHTALGLGLGDTGPRPSPRTQGPDGEDKFVTFGFQADGTDVVIHATDWTATRAHAGEGRVTTYAVQGRRALVMRSPPDLARRLMPALLPQSFTTPLSLAEAVATFGYTVNGELPDARPEPGTESWYVVFERKGEWFSVTVVDWSEVADGKVPQEAVARSKDAFVVVRSSVPGKARAILDQLLP